MSPQDWGIAFDAFADALLYIWPNQLWELTRYKRHINKLFWILQECEYSQIVEYNKAIWTKFTQTRDFLLHQHHMYSELKDIWLGGAFLITAVRSSPVRVTIQHGQPKSSAACQKFNFGTCFKSEHECTYRHVCMVCGSSGHVKGNPNCEGNKGKGGKGKERA